MIIVKIIFRLYIIQVSAFLAVWFSTYYPGLDILLTFIYLIIVRAEARWLKGYTRKKILLFTLIWQGPAIFLSLLLISDFYIYVLSQNAIFLLEFWDTPLLPLLTPLTDFNYFNKPLYYYLLLAIPWLSAIYYYVMGSLMNKAYTSNTSGYEQ